MKVTKCFLITLILLLCSCFQTTTHSNPDYAKTPIFFVHGHGMKARCWKPMISYLTKGGYPHNYLKAIQLHPNNGSNIDAAEKQIAPAIEDFLKEINVFLEKEYPAMPLKTKVDLISHSMGAMSARWYAAKIRPDRVRIWISFGGANHGTNVLCKWSDPGANDCCPAYAPSKEDSLIQYTLNGAPHAADIDETPYGIGKDSPGTHSIPPDERRKMLYITFRTSPDKWIKPETSPILDGAGGLKMMMPENVRAKQTSPGNILMTNRVGHDAMLSDADTMQLTKVFLEL